MPELAQERVETATRVLEEHEGRMSRPVPCRVHRSSGIISVLAILGTSVAASLHRAARIVEGYAVATANASVAAIRGALRAAWLAGEWDVGGFEVRCTGRGRGSGR